MFSPYEVRGLSVHLGGLLFRSSVFAAPVNFKREIEGADASYMHRNVVCFLAKFGDGRWRNEVSLIETYLFGTSWMMRLPTRLTCPFHSSQS